jgi:RNA polymerase sigma-70 factor (ECF subfamily)
MDHDEIRDHFLAVYDQYADDIFRFCALKVSNRETAQDIAQETFMRFWQQLRQGADVKSERALLYTIARNLVIDWYRRRREQSLDAMTDEGFEFASDDHGSITDHAQLREVLEAIKDLDEPSREALTLRYVEGFSPREIAALSGETANAVSVRINRAIKKVQARLRITDHE